MYFELTITYTGWVRRLLHCSCVGSILTYSGSHKMGTFSNWPCLIDCWKHNLVKWLFLSTSVVSFIDVYAYHWTIHFLIPCHFELTCKFSKHYDTADVILNCALFCLAKLTVTNIFLMMFSCTWYTLLMMVFAESISKTYC